MARKKRHDTSEPSAKDPLDQELAEEKTDAPPPRSRGATSSRDDVARLVRLLQTNAPEALRNSVVDGLVNAILGDEGLVRNITDRNIPKEAAGFLVAGAETTRRELVRIVSKEVRNFLATIDLGGELTKILTSVTFEMTFKAGFTPNNQTTTTPTPTPTPPESADSTDTQPPAPTRNYKELLWNVVNDRLIQPSLNQEATQTTPDVTDDEPESSA